MLMLTVRLSPDIVARLTAEANARGLNRSEFLRLTLERHLPIEFSKEEARELWNDDWAGFGGKVIEAQRSFVKKVSARVFSSEFNALSDELVKAFDRVLDDMRDDPAMQWSEFVEPIYGVFVDKALEKTRSFGHPVLRQDRSGEIVIAADLGFAADHVVDMQKTLEDALYSFGVDYGDEAFDKVAEIWAKVKARYAADDARQAQSG